MAADIVAALEAADISVSGHTLLRDVSLHLLPGSLAVIHGPGGGGKSCLLRAFWGAVPLERGKVIGDNQDLTDAPPRRWAAWRRRVGIFCDDFPLCDSWTLLANVAAALYTTEKLPENVVVQRTNATLQKWGLLSQRHLPARLLSGGEHVRACLARAFVRRPVAAFLDDPLRRMPPDERQNIWESIRGEARAGTAVCLTSARDDLPASGDNVYLIERERVRHVARPTSTAATG
jgi:ABC-type ATPase involved in cell division